MRPRPDSLLVWSGATCINGCAACPIDREGSPTGLEADRLLRQLQRLGAPSGRLAVVVGGEPFLRQDCWRLFAAIRSAGWSAGVVSTGRPLIYPAVRQRLRRLGLAYLRVQLFGVGVDHDSATAVDGGYEQACAGLQSWLAESDEDTIGSVDIGLSIRRREPSSLVETIESIADRFPSANLRIVVSLDQEAIGALHDSQDLRTRLAELANWNDAPNRPLLAWEEGPGRSLGLDGLTIAPHPPVFAGDAPIASCLGRRDPESPVRDGVRANSFNFLRTSTTVNYEVSAESCTAADAGAKSESLRSLWLIDEGQLVLHETDTGDFVDGEIERVKDTWSHLFVDRAQAGVLDDFTEGMRRVLPDPECDTCLRRTRCARRYRTVDGPPFAREEAWISSYVAGIRGSVLDVGCGEQLYRNELAPLLKSGVVTYTGIDPDEPSLAHAREALPEGSFQIGGIEDYRSEPEAFDHILCLRALNHVYNLDEAFARMNSMLKPGGSLLLVETTPFAMLRRNEQVVAADRAPRAGHQHLRNLTSHEVVPYARKFSLRVVEHSPASLATTNEWILLLQKAHK